jgi:hypothetical protein
MKTNLTRKLIFLLIGMLPFLAKGQDSRMANELKVDAKTKPDKEYTYFSTITIDQLAGFRKGDQPIATNIYGSRLDKKVSTTGFFRAEFVNGRWWIIDPEGYLNICRGVNDIKPGGGSASKSVYAERFGDSSEIWMTKTMEYLNEIGFNCVGSWSNTGELVSNPRQTKNPLAYTIILNWMSGYGGGRTHQQAGHRGYPNNAIFVFEKGFATYCDTKAAGLVKNKDDKNLFGYFTDNELPFYSKSLNMFLRLGKTSPDNEIYVATKNWLTENGYAEADTVNEDIRAKFLGFVGETYFSIVDKAMKKYDPNHMNLGSRVNVKEALNNKYFMEAAGKYVDVLTVNYYNVWTPDSTSMTNWGTNLNKPFMITEFYTKGEDSGLGNTAGAGWIVKTQLERGFAYQHFTLGLLESKYCVGWHWFKYMDNDPTVSAEPSNTDGNKGILRINYEPYVPLVEKMKELNLRVYNLIDYFDKRK